MHHLIEHDAARALQPVEDGGALLAGALAAGIHQNIGTMDALAKCRRIHRSLQNDFKGSLHFGESELGPQQLQRQGAVATLDPQSLQSSGDKLGMIEGEAEAGQGREWMPATVHGFDFRIDQTEVDQRGGPATGIPLQIAESADLFAVAVAEPPLRQQAMAGRVQVPIPSLVDAQCRQLPAVGKGGVIAGFEQQLEPLLVQPQHHHIQTHSQHVDRPARLPLMFGR